MDRKPFLFFVAMIAKKMANYGFQVEICACVMGNEEYVLSLVERK